MAAGGKCIGAYGQCVHCGEWQQVTSELGLRDISQGCDRAPGNSVLQYICVFSLLLFVTLISCVCVCCFGKG